GPVWSPGPPPGSGSTPPCLPQLGQPIENILVLLDDPIHCRHELSVDVCFRSLGDELRDSAAALGQVDDLARCGGIDELADDRASIGDRDLLRHVPLFGSWRGHGRTVHLYSLNVQLNRPAAYDL